MRLIRFLLGVLSLCAPALAAAAQLLVLNKADATLVFVDPASGRIEATIGTGEGPHEIELSPDGKLAFVTNYGAQSDGNSISVIDASARKELRRIDLGDLKRPHGLTFMNDRVYFTAERARKVGALDAAFERVDWTFATDQEGTHMVLAARGGSALYTTNIGSGTVSLIERSGNDQWKQTLLQVGAGPEGLDLAPDGRELWVGHSRDGGISIIDTATKRVAHTFDAKTRRSNRVKFTRDGRWVLVSDLSAGELLVFDARTRTEYKRLPLGRVPTGILVPPSGNQAYVAVSGDNHIAVIDLKSFTVSKKLETGGSPDGMAWLN